MSSRSCCAASNLLTVASCCNFFCPNVRSFPVVALNLAVTTCGCVRILQCLCPGPLAPNLHLARPAVAVLVRRPNLVGACAPAAAGHCLCQGTHHEYRGDGNWCRLPLFGLRPMYVGGCLGHVGLAYCQGGCLLLGEPLGLFTNQYLPRWHWGLLWTLALLQQEHTIYGRCSWLMLDLSGQPPRAERRPGARAL